MLGAAAGGFMTTRRRGLLAGAIVAIGVVIAVGVLALRGVVADWSGGDRGTFPAIDASVLEPRQARVIEVLRTEFDAQRPGTTYSEGITEPWCADFVSFVMREAGMPLANPNSGAWRIPGVYTLQEYYQSAGRFEPPSYRPVAGDVVLYDDPSPFGQHTNVVVANDNGVLTTVGGNEGGIRVRNFTAADDQGIVGFGRL